MSAAEAPRPTFERSPFLLVLLLGAAVAALAGYGIGRPQGLGLGFGQIVGLLASPIAWVIAALACTRLTRWGRAAALAATLLVCGALLVVTPGGQTQEHDLTLIMVRYQVLQLAAATAVIFGVTLALESMSTGARLAALFEAATSLAVLATDASMLVGTAVNPDFLQPTMFNAFVGVAVAIVAAAALAMLLRGRARAAVERLRPNVTAALQEAWLNRPVRLTVGAYLLQVVIAEAMVQLGVALTTERPQPTNFSSVTWLFPACGLVGLLVGATLADLRRRRGRNLASIAFWAVGGEIVLFLLAAYIDDSTQSLALFAIASAVGGAATMPVLATLNDGVAPGDRPAIVGLMLALVAQLAIIGLAPLLSAVALAFGGPGGTTLDIGFWGSVSIKGGQGQAFLIPLKVTLDLGDPQGTVQAIRTACTVLAVALAAVMILYRTASRASPVAAAIACQACGAQNGTSDRFCRACGEPLPTPRKRSAAQADAGRRLLGAATVAVGAAAVVVMACMAADAAGMFHKTWTSAVVWKPPPGTDDALKACRDWPCATTVLTANHAPAETTRFMQMLQADGAAVDVGYPTALDGKGRVKVVTIYAPGEGMEGTNEFVFVNGSREAVRPTDGVETLANANTQYADFKSQYPQVMIWGDTSLRKEVIGPDGSQQFQFQEVLLNGCHACGVLGQLVVGYNFDPRGHYTGATIVGVEADKGAPYSAITDRLAQETQYSFTLTQQQPDGSVASSNNQTILSEKDHCRLALQTSGQVFTGGYFSLTEAFNLRDVVVGQAAAVSLPAPPPSNAAPAVDASGQANPQPPPIAGPPQPPAPANLLAIQCTPFRGCISQDYSDARGHAQPLPRVMFTVPIGTVDATTRDLRALQAMCAG